MKNLKIIFYKSNKTLKTNKLNAYTVQWYDLGSLTFKVDERICMGHLPRIFKATCPVERGFKILFLFCY